jgi:hypothetical protein
MSLVESPTFKENGSHSVLINITIIAARLTHVKGLGNLVKYFFGSSLRWLKTFIISSSLAITAGDSIFRFTEAFSHRH